MSEEEKLQFIGDIRYFWQEKGDIERHVDYSPERLREADPVLASAYEQLKVAEEAFNRLIRAGNEEV